MNVGVDRFHSRRVLSLSKKHSCIVAFVVVLLALNFVSFGQAGTSRKVDYGVAVQEFIKQGFPSIEGAKYVKVVDQNLQWNCDGFWFDEVQAMNKLTGNGFYIPNKDSAKPGRFIFFGGCELSYVKKGKRVPANVDYQALTRGDIKMADLKKDIAIVQKWAATASTEENFEYYGTENFSVIFGFANLIYQMGYKKEANELFKTIFLNHEGPEKIIDHMVNALAEREYSAVYHAFQQNTDWQKYHAELLRLQGKYPRGWENQPGLELLIPQVKNRMDKLAVVSPEIDGHVFSPEIQKIIASTANPPKSQAYHERQNLFLINKVKKNTGAPPFLQLTQHGMDGFIALVSLIGDKTLVVKSSGYNSYGSRRYTSYDDGRRSAENAYDSLDKPSTRGAVAEGLVRATMPHDYNTLGQMESEQLKRFAIDWWKKHRNDSKMVLTKHYLQQGNQSHAQSLATALMQQDTEESRALLEKSILTSKKPSNLSEIVRSYVKKRREKAKEFISKYKVVLTSELGDGKEDGPYSIRKLGGTDKFIASLMRYTAGLKPSQMLTKLSRKDAKVGELMEMLTVAYQGKDLSKDLNKFIYAAAKKKNVSEQITILSSLIEIMYPEAIGAGRLEGAALGGIIEGVPEGVEGGAINRKRLIEMLESGTTDGFVIKEPKVAKTEPAKSREISFSKYVQEDWEKLLFSNAAVRRTKVSTLAGMLLDKFANPDRKREEYSESQSLGTEIVDKMIKERSRALLDGKKLDPLPKSDLVSTAQKKKVLKLFKDAKPNVLRKVLLEMSYSERLVVMEDESYEPRLTQAAPYIQGFAPQTPMYEVEDIEKLNNLLKPIVGKSRDPQVHDQCANILLKNIDKFAGLSVSLNSYSSLPGSDIGIYDLAADKGDLVKKAKADVIAGKISGFVSVLAYERNEVTATLIYSNGKYPTKEELEKLAKSNNISITASTKASIEKQQKALATSAVERKKIIDEIIKLSPELERHKESFEKLKLEQLKTYHQQFK